jgi:hypothetical protein
MKRVMSGCEALGGMLATPPHRTRLGDAHMVDRMLVTQQWRAC